MTRLEVRQTRKRLGLTQAELARELGVTASSVARWEQGVIGIRESAARLLQLLAKQSPSRPRKGQRRR